MRDVASADVRIEGTTPHGPIGFGITRAIAVRFATGKMVTATVAGSPT